jgi:hypothetical protein
MASAAAERGKGFTNLPKIQKEKGLGRNPTLGLIPMVLQGHHLPLQFGNLRLCHIARSREPLPDEHRFRRRIHLKILQERDDISLSFIENESTKDSGARPIRSIMWP